MSTPNPTPTPTLEERIAALEGKVITDVRGTWQKVDAFFWAVLSHARSISVSAAAFSVAALALKLYHQIGL